MPNVETSDGDENDPPVSRRENKKMVRAAMVAAFGDEVETQDICTGTVTYTVIRLAGENFNIAAIYGSRLPGSQSIWVKEAVWQTLDDELREDLTTVDVALFNRGWQWAIHSADVQDPAFDAIAEAAVAWGRNEKSQRDSRQAEKAERARKREARKAEMDAKRAAWRAEREKDEEAEAASK